MKQARRLSHRHRRGSALLLAIFFLMLLFLIAVALFRLIPTELHSAGRSRQDMQAHYACSAGVKNAASWLSAVVDPTDFGALAPVLNEPFRMDQHPDPTCIAYTNPGGNSATNSYTTDNQLARFNGTTGGDFDGVSFGVKPYLVNTQDIVVDDWTVRVWIFPDRQTFPVPEYFFTDCCQAGDSNLSLSLRYYTIVAEAYPFNDTTRPRMRAKVTLGQQNFAKYARFVDTWPGDTPYTAQLNTKTVDGPFHTNDFFIIRPASSSYFDPATAFNGTSSFQTLSYAGEPDAGDTDVTWADFTNRDGIAYKGGNFQGSNNANLPFDGGGNAKTNAYEKLTGGVSNIRNVDSIGLPTTTSDLQLAAWGFDAPNPVIGAEGGTFGHGGLFVKDAGGSVDGGVYLKGDTREMVLGVADANGNVNFRDTAVTQSGNPAMLVQFSNSVVSNTLDPAITNTFTTSSTTNVSVGSTMSTSYTPTVVGSNTYPTTSLQITPVYTQSVTTGWNYTITQSTSYTVTVIAGGGGFGNDITTTITNTTPVTIGSNMTTGTTNVFVSNNTQTFNITATNYTYSTVTSSTSVPVYSVSTNYSTGTQVTASTRYYPTDRLIEVTDTPITLPVTMSGKILTQNGNPISAPLSVGTGNIVVIKDSRTNGREAEVSILSGTLNGVVYSEGNINNLHGVNKGKKTIAVDLGDAGAETGKNIQIGIPVAQNLGGGSQNRVGSFRYPNNFGDSQDTYNNNSNNAANHDRADLLQWGVTPGQMPSVGGHSLGLVGQRVGINIHRRDLTSSGNRGLYRNNNSTYATGGNRPPLRIYAVILAGRGGDQDDDTPNSAVKAKGGFRIFNLAQNGQTDYQNLTNGKSTIQSGQNQYGYFKLFGGIIERRGAANWMAQGTSFRGWDMSTAFDEWTARVTPPFFPVTSQFAAQLYIEEFPNATYQAKGVSSNEGGWINGR